MTEYKINKKFQKLLPKMSKEEKAALRASLRIHGYKSDTIKAWNGTIIDGHTCYEICREEGIPFEVKEMEFENEDEVIFWIIQTHLARRHLNDAQKVQLVLPYEAMLKEQAKKNQSEAGKNRHKKNDDAEIIESEIVPADEESEDSEIAEVSELEEREEDVPKLVQADVVDMTDEKEPEKKRNLTTNEKLAKLAGVKKETFRKCKKVLEDGSQELQKEMLDGVKSIHAAYSEVMGSSKKNDISENASGKIYPFPGVYEHESVSQMSVSYIDEIKSLKDYQFTDANGENVTAKMVSDIEGVIDFIEELQEKLSGMKITDGIVELKMAVNL